MKKSLVTTLTAIVMLITFLGPMISVQPALAADPTSWYKTVSGVLGTDTYTLYPYAAKSLTIGFSKFGELIDGTTKIGLAYDLTDPFAPDGGSPPEYQWVEGWVLNVTYYEGGDYHNVWAKATYSDYNDANGIGGDWHEGVTVGPVNDTVKGGRKTSGGAVTEPYQVLYDGPRRFVALCRTTIYADVTHLQPLLNLTFTIDFNKVKKYVTILKDVKRIDTGKNIGDMQIEFGDRGEWDLGAGTPPKSYAHFFTSQPTKYDYNWQPWYNTTLDSYNSTYDVCQIITDGVYDTYNYVGWAAFWPKPITSWVGGTVSEANRDRILTTITTITEDQVGNGTKRNFVPVKGTPTEYPQQNATGIFWMNDPMVFANNKYKSINRTLEDPENSVTYYEGNYTVTFPDSYIPGIGDIVRMVYKVNRTKTDMAIEPASPFVIGEWAFKMNEAPSIFRGVTVYGVTDLHDGKDLSRDGVPDQLDREVKYQLDEVFNPWDLQDAIHEKDTSRWVQYYNATTLTYVTLDHHPVIDVSDSEWDQYGVFSERVEDVNTSEVGHRIDLDPLVGEYADYTWDVNASGYATVGGLPLGHMYKILYSTYSTLDFTAGGARTSGFTLVQNGTQPNFYNSTSLNQTVSADTYDTTVDYLGATHRFDFDFAHIMRVYNDTRMSNGSLTLNGALTFNVTDIKVFKENTGVIDFLKLGNGWNSSDWEASVTNTTDSALINLTQLSLKWTVTPPSNQLSPPQNLDLHIDSANITYSYVISIDYWHNTTGWYFNYSYAYTVTAHIEEHIPFRYEWIVVGRDAVSVDSAGASLVSAAFKNKQVEIGLAGVDMYHSSPPMQMPWVMAKIGAGTDSSNYYYNNWGGIYTGDKRTALKDDWCTTWPITTSNMISVGGPLANLLGYYENDFTEAFYGLSDFTSDSIWQNHIVALTCWNAHNATNAYASSNLTGYGVVTTYLDINGTEVLQIWGHWGRDTYYLTKYFHDYLIYQLQQAPHGLTSIIVKIDYHSYAEGYKPYNFSIVECLGTISERRWIHESETKGGIHDCPDAFAKDR